MAQNTPPSTSNEAAIDADFALMADDATYQAESERLAKEFAFADWEAFQLGESASFSPAISPSRPPKAES